MNNKFYVADFETTNYDYYLKNGYTKVWLYAICDDSEKIVSIGDSIEAFFKALRKLYGKTIYFHNLKFDGSFILDYLLRNGYSYYDSEEYKKVNKGFTCLIGEMGEFYSLSIKFTKGKQVRIFDSLKLLPFKVSKIAKDFHFGDDMQKEVIDYGDYTIDAKRIEYVSHDVQIVARALKLVKAEGMIKMTTASCAYNMYTSSKSNDFLSLSFPDLPDDFLTEWREAYRGGRSQVNPYYQGSIVHNCKRYDINSMYPYVLHDMPMPYGNPIPITTKGKYKFELYHLKIDFGLKKNHLPSLLRKQALYNKDDTYYINTTGMEEIWITSPDYMLLKRNYNIYREEFINGYGFMTSTLMFYDYVDKWYAKKKVDVGAPRIVDKLMLNCLYGKYGSKNKGFHKYPYITDDNSVGYKCSDVEDMTKYYLPVALATVSWAHVVLDDGIQSTGVSNFVYCDTDSVHTLGTIDDSLVSPTQLGKYKLEAIEETAKYVRQKTYVTKEEGKINITCAGMTDSMKKEIINKYGENIFNEFKIGFMCKGKLLPKRVKGGVILYETTFEIK